MFIPVLPSSPECIIVGGCFSFQHASQMFETGAHVLPPVPDETDFYLLYSTVLTLTAELDMYDLTNCTRSTK